MPEPRPKTVNGALTSPPPDGTFAVVMRRTDRKAWPWREAMYDTTFIARAITHPDGKTAPTIFVPEGPVLRGHRKQLLLRGWQDVTAAWFEGEARAAGVPDERPRAVAARIRGAIDAVSERMTDAERAATDWGAVVLEIRSDPDVDRGSESSILNAMADLLQVEMVEPSEPALTEEEIVAMSYAELQGAAKARGLGGKGTKGDLMQALRDHAAAGEE